MKELSIGQEVRIVTMLSQYFLRTGYVRDVSINSVQVEIYDVDLYSSMHWLPKSCVEKVEPEKLSNKRSEKKKGPYLLIDYPEEESSIYNSLDEINVLIGEIYPDREIHDDSFEIWDMGRQVRLNIKSKLVVEDA